MRLCTVASFIFQRWNEGMSEMSQAVTEQERTHMDNKNGQEIEEQSLTVVTRGASEERQAAICGEVEKISATVEQSRRESELAERLAFVEHDLAELKAAASTTIANPLRRTIPASTSE